MEVFRITTEQWAHGLTASGYAARWNSGGHFVLYAASSRSLACLENVVHRSSLGFKAVFRTMVIFIPDSLHILSIHPADLPDGWNNTTDFANEECRKIGDAWYLEGQSAVLKVPSALIKNEFNYLINARHPEMDLIRIIDVELFDFDPRIKGG